MDLLEVLSAFNPNSVEEKKRGSNMRDYFWNP